MSSDKLTRIHNRHTNTQRALSDQSRNARSRSQPVYASRVAVVPIHSIPNRESGYISLGMWQVRVASLSDVVDVSAELLLEGDTAAQTGLISTRQLGIIDQWSSVKVDTACRQAVECPMIRTLTKACRTRGQVDRYQRHHSISACRRKSPSRCRKTLTPMPRYFVVYPAPGKSHGYLERVTIEKSSLQHNSVAKKENNYQLKLDFFRPSGHGGPHFIGSGRGGAGGLASHQGRRRQCRGFCRVSAC